MKAWQNERLIQTVVGVALLVAVGASVYQQLSLKRELEQKSGELASSTAELRLAQASLAQLTGEKEILAEDLEAEKEKTEAIEEQVSEIAGTVGELDKLRKIDPELLQKYSKVYFLNEHYVPSKLSLIKEEYWHNPDKPMEFHGEVVSRLERMLKKAKEAGIDLRVASAFRSFYDQASLKSAYSVVYGSGANKFSADQGYSEHQLATTVDLVVPGAEALTTAFGETAGYKWLAENAYRYGFTLSYPKGNAYYQYEPWHWRFVGLDLARELHDEGKYFYDLDQREIDKYLISFFD